MKLIVLLGSLSFLASQANAASSLTHAQHAPAWNGATYSANSTLQYDIDQRALASISFSGTEHVLDLGCGDGAITALIASKVPHGRVVGSDCAPAMTEFAQKTYSPQYPNISFTTSYVEDIAYQNEFDVVTSFCMLHWVSDLPTAFTKIYNAVKPGGRILLFFPVMSQKNIWRRLLRETMEKPKWKALIKNMPVESSHPDTALYFESMCKQIGFTSCTANVAVIPYTFSTIDTFKSWFKALAWIKALPDEHHDAFLNDFVERMLSHDKPATGACTVHSAYATIWAKKPL
jgi:trans-aconitate 2-methyltransferase